MITGELKNKIDKLWLEFWQGGITNPLTVIEQVTFLMFSRLLDINETRDEKREKRTGKSFSHRFKENEQHLRWSDYIHVEDPEKLLKRVRDEVFPHFRSHAGDTRFGDYMKDASLIIEKPSLLVKAVEMIDTLPLESGDTKGDLYEYLLSKLTTAGINGQFRTPRHIIKLMVRMIDPRPDETIADPACGTAGFLVSALEYVLEKYTSEEGEFIEEIENQNGKIEKQITYSGDLLDQTQWDHIKRGMFHGFDFDNTMLRIGAMNLWMHGTQDPDIHYQDTLAQSFADNFPHAEKDRFDVVFANPPFKGNLDAETINPAILRIVKTKKTELLFVAQIMRMLKQGGRAAIIVPQGVLFGSSTAHRTLCELLVEQNQLEAVINLPSGVFKPYAGVATGILIFTKGGKTDHVFFYDVEHDGFSLDDKRESEPDKDDLKDVLKEWNKRDKSNSGNKKNDRTKKHFWVSREELAKNKYDLLVNRYKKIEYEEIKYDSPKVILQNLETLENEIQEKLANIKEMIN